LLSLHHGLGRGLEGLPCGVLVLRSVPHYAERLLLVPRSECVLCPSRPRLGALDSGVRLLRHIAHLTGDAHGGTDGCSGLGAQIPRGQRRVLAVVPDLVPELRHLARDLLADPQTLH